jgi:osmoprotectant transport system permease protein
VKLIEFWLAHRSEFLSACLQHLALVVISTGIAVAIGIPLGVIAHRRPRLGAPLVGAANIIQTIPSLALFGFLIPLPFLGGIGARAALVALTLYALLPVIRTTVSGLGSIDPAVREAGLAMGMTPRQLLWIVELPLARQSILTGVRVATVTGVGTATIAAAIGAGGLGEYIFRGVAMVDSKVILAGAAPAALLALLADFALGWLEKRLAPGRRAPRFGRTASIVTVSALVVALVLGAIYFSRRTSGRVVRVGSKNFTEQLILGEIMAQLIERGTDLKVERRLNLGGTLVCEEAMRAGDLDLYVEYTGTALTAVFKQPVALNSDEVNRRVAAGYESTGRRMMPALGFNNTFAILIRGVEARRLGLRKISEAAAHTPQWRAGFGPEFLDREDGFKGLARVYGLRFAEAPRAMDLSLTYRALADHRVDLIAGDSTNGLIEKLDLFMLEDDRQYFPPYLAVPIIRREILTRYPELGRLCALLAGKISEREMRRMNAAADVDGRDVTAVARDFLASRPEIFSR